jgi:hypothetical protein
VIITQKDILVLESDVDRIISSFKEDGVKIILKIVFNSLMKGERDIYIVNII